MFKTLLDNPNAEHPARLQRAAARRFRQVVGRSKLKLFDSYLSVSDDPFIIVGVATYDPLELELLDRLHQNAPKWKHRFVIYVFDVASLDAPLAPSFDQIAHVFPWFPILLDGQLWAIEQTPVAFVSKAFRTIAFQQGLGRAQRILEELDVL